MEKYLSNSEEETKKLAAKIAKEKQNRIFALSGSLGAGKTIFVQGFAEGLTIKEKILSPTFVLIRHHRIPNTSKTLYHIDLYRLEDIKNIKQLGLQEIWTNPNNIIIIEWAQKIKEFLPKNTLWIYFEIMDYNKREIIVK